MVIFQILLGKKMPKLILLSMPGKNSGEITKIAIQKKVIMRMKWLFHELKFFELAKLTIISKLD